LNRAVFRVDASAAIGGGHVMRCLALADALQDAGWKTSFACSQETLATATRLRESDNDILVIEDSDNEPAALAAHWPDGADFLIVDHYGRDIRFESACRPWAEKILVIDDLANRDHDCDLLMDQTLGIDLADYESLVPATCGILQGPDYAPLRSEFFTSRQKSISGRQGKLERLIISVGLTDPSNISARLLEGFVKSGLKLEVEVILGRASPKISAVKAQVENIPSASLSLDVTDMANRLTRGDLVIGAGGSSAWERCCLGVPALMVQADDNQNRVAKALSKAGAAYVLGTGENFDEGALVEILRRLNRHPEDVCDMSRASAAICDGRGALRLMMFISPEKSRDGSDITLRPAGPEDAEKILEWQAHPETRRYARNLRTPEPEEHQEWLHGKLADPGCLLNIVLLDGKPAGLLRLDLLKESNQKNTPVHEVSILTAPDCYRQGVARAALALGRRLLPESRLHGEVLEGNTASHALFQSAQFGGDGTGYTAAPLYAETRV